VGYRAMSRQNDSFLKDLFEKMGAISKLSPSKAGPAQVGLREASKMAGSRAIPVLFEIAAPLL
jgi:hypothetical protein